MKEGEEREEGSRRAPLSIEPPLLANALEHEEEGSRLQSKIRMFSLEANQIGK